MKPRFTVITHKSNSNPLNANPIFFTLKIVSEGASLLKMSRRMVEPGLLDPPQPCTSMVVVTAVVRAAIIGCGRSPS